MPTYQHIFSGDAANVPYQFSMHTAISSGNIDDAHTAATAWVTNLMDGDTPPGTGMTWLTRNSDVPSALKTYELDDFTGRKVNVKSSALALVGNSPDSQLPSGVCMCLTLRGGQIGRKERGRIFLWPFTSSSNDSGEIGAAAFGFAVPAVRYAYTQLYASLYIPVIFHPTPVGFSSVTAVDISNVWAFVDSRRANRPIQRHAAYP
jgi:hypothetical protein